MSVILCHHRGTDESKTDWVSNSRYPVAIPGSSLLPGFGPIFERCGRSIPARDCTDHRLDCQPLAALSIGGEQVAQATIANLLVMGGDGLLRNSFVEHL